jgi:hypothetical protein
VSSAEWLISGSLKISRSADPKIAPDDDDAEAAAA